MKLNLTTLIICLLLPSLFISCRERIELNKALVLAGDNKVELEKVLNHYDALLRQAEAGASDDSVSVAQEKLESARFLIANMPGHTSMVGGYREYYSFLDSIWTSRNDPLTQEEIIEYENLFSKRISISPIITRITADYLIDNIESAYKDWKEREWAGHLSFPLFCEFILPYTCSQYQPLDNWRDRMEPFAGTYVNSFSECYDYQGDPDPAAGAVNSELKRMVSHMSGRYPDRRIKIYDESLFVKSKTPFNCTETSEMTTLVMRSKGIPVTYDYVPQWPDGDHGHVWTVLWSVHDKALPFSPMWSAPGVPFVSHRRFAKVFRRTYSINREYREFLNKGKENVDVAGGLFFKDVTDEYAATSDIIVELDKRIPAKYAYIATFNNFVWRPVWYGRVHGKKAVFKGMGRDITYIVLAQSNNGLIPASEPFRLDKQGQLFYIRPDLSKETEVHIDRKYPMRRHVFNLNTLGHGLILASNDKAKWDTIAKIDKFPITSGVVSIKDAKSYRYWSFCSDNTFPSDMAELFFYDSSGLNDKFKTTSRDKDFELMFDNDPLSYYSAKTGDLKGFADFGEPQAIEKIEYIKRGDGNAVVPGKRYRLSFWKDDSWELITDTVAEDVFLNIGKVPDGALLYINCPKEGRENRIFLWDAQNKKVVWQ